MSYLPTQAPPHPGDWNCGVEEYVAQNNISCEEAVPLSSGTSCYIWRLEGLTDVEATANGHQKGQSVIMKCADSAPKYQKFSVSPERLGVEVKALSSKAVEEACRQEPSIRVPRVLRETKNGFIMSFVGEIDLRTAYKTDEQLNMTAIGARLGRWLGALHLAGIALGPDGWNSYHDELAKFYIPGGLAETSIRASMGEEEVDAVLAAMRAPVQVHTLTPWDFRPMNVVLQVPEDKETQPGLAVVDWELCHYGDPSEDIRMWVAEVMLLEAKFGDRGLLSSFLATYKQKVGSAIIDESFVCRVALSAGIYILFLVPRNPRVWDCTEDDIDAWKQKSLEYIRAGATKNVSWLEDTCLKPLL